MGDVITDVATMSTDDQIREKLAQRLGRVHARQRLGIEGAHEAQVFGQGLNFFNFENWYSAHSVLRAGLTLIGAYGRGHRNTQRIQIRRIDVPLPALPAAFDGFTILHISDMHVDMNRGAMHRLVKLLEDLTYDICVMTGDFRGKTYGSFAATLAGLAPIRERLTAPVYAVLGNHDTIRMVPGLEELGVRVLLNEADSIARGGERIWLGGIDDAHYYRVDNIEKVATLVPHGEFSVLLSHTPEIYRQAAHADFRLLLCGHTHGGQICLPGSIPITLDSAMPRRYGSGLWAYHGMIGYTSVGVGSSIVPVRFNCPPEIALHRLRRA
ncbi:MAG: metallophosphoesterase [Gemmatimonas sp.]